MAYTNNNGQVRVGVRSGITNSPIIQPAFSASLIQSLYGVWNGDTTTNELDKSLFGVWNAENSTNTLDTNIYSVFTDTTTYTHPGVTSSQFGLWDAEGLGLNDKVGTNHLTPFGSATFSTDSILGTKSFTFNGGNYFGLPVNSWNFTGDFSLSFWVKSNWPGSGGVIPISNNVWSQTSPSIKYSGWDIRTSGAFPIFYGVSGGTTSFYIQSAVQCVNNVWSNVVVTKSNSVVSIYVNGLLGGTSSVTGNITYAATSYPSIGAQKYSSAGVSDYIGNGSKIDDVAVWTRTLSHDDVIAIYNSGSGQSYPYSLPTAVSVDKSQSLKGFIIGTGSSVVSGKTGNAISLTQSSAIILKDRSALKFTGDFSVSFWFRTPDVSTGKTLISTHDGTKGWWIYIASSNIIWSSGGSTNVTFGFNPTTLVANTWYHVAVSLTNNVDIKCYLNGVLGGQQSMVSKTITYDYWNVLHPGVIGGRANRNVNTSIEIDYRFTGTIDDINTWNRALSSNEVDQLYNGGNGVEYPYVGKTLSSPNDSFGTNNGTLIGGCTYTTGKVGNAFTFDGVNDYVALPDNIFNFTGDFSASAWFYSPSSTYTHSGIVGNYNWGTKTGWGIYTYQNRLYVNIYNVAGDYSTAYIDNSVVGSWNHVTMVFKKGTGFYLYMNGELKNSFTLTNNVNAGISPAYSATQKAYIGLLNYSGDWWYAKNGYKIDGVNVWQRSISQDEITQLYNSGTGAQYPFTGTFSSAGNQLGVDNGTLMNGCYLSDGKIGKAFTFDGVNDYVQLPDNSLNFTGDFSFSFWIYNDNMPLGVNRRYIGSSYYSGSGTYGFGWTLLRGSDNVYRFQLFNGDSNPNSLFSSNMDLITINEWTHIVVTRKRSTQSKIYKNGVDVTSNFSYTLGSNTINCGYNSTQYCTIGALKDNNTSTFGYIKGKMDSVLVYQKELTQSEITELYNSGNGKQITTTPIVQTGLILNLDASRSSSYPGTGTTWTDISGSGNNGTLVNGVGYSSVDGGSLVFDGVNDWVENLSSTLLNNLSKFTLNTWFKVNNTSLNNSIFSFNWNSAGLVDILLGVYGNYLFCQVDNGQDGGGYIQNFTSTSWNNVQVVFDGTLSGNSNRLKIYLNGVLLTLQYDSYTVPATTANNASRFALGAYINGNFNNRLFGNIANCLIYNTALSASEVTQNFNATKSRFGL